MSDNVTDSAGAVLAQPNQQSEADAGIANTTSVANATAPPAPDINDVPRSTKFNVIKTPGQAAAEQAAAADNAHHNLFGRAVKATFHALNNTQAQYVANPQTGRIEEVSVPAKPGQFFRNLLSGMLIGAAAGSERPTDKEGRPMGGGFAGGFGRGLSAQMGQRQQQDQQQYARAQQDLKNQEEREKLDSEEQWHSAMVAHENVATADLMHNMHAADAAAHDKHNAAARAYERSLTAAGGFPSKMSIGGKLVDTIDGSSFQAAFTKDPSIAQAPPGYERHFISTTDLSELHFDGDHWVDDSGEPVNIGKGITIRAFDLPTSTFKTPRQVKGKEINAARRQKIVDDNSNYSVSPEGMSALYTVGTKEAAETARANHQRSQDDQRNKNARTFTQIESKKASALAKAEHTYWSNLNAGKDGDNALSELNAAKQESQNAYESEIRAAGGTPQHFEYGNASAPQTKPQPRTNRQAPKVFSASKWQAANPNGDVNAAIDEAKRQGMTVTR
jgi:hypothetical protein